MGIIGTKSILSIPNLLFANSPPTIVSPQCEGPINPAEVRCLFASRVVPTEKNLLPSAPAWRDTRSIHFQHPTRIFVKSVADFFRLASTIIL